MRLGGVGARYEHNVLIRRLRDGIGHCAGAEGYGEARNGGGMAETRAVVNVVCANGGAHHLLEYIVILIGTAGAGKTRQSIRAAFRLDGLYLIGNVCDGLAPLRLNQLPSLADKGLLKAILVVDEAVAEFALHAHEALIGGAVKGLSANHLVVLNDKVHLAANAAVCAGGGHFLGFKGAEALL